MIATMNGSIKKVRDSKPPRIEVVIDNVPKSMRDLPRWLGWRWRWRDTKWDKPPVDVHNGGPGSSTDADSWADVETAHSAYAMGTVDIDGIGVALGEVQQGVHLLGVDLDNCRNRETGEVLPVVDDIVRMFDCYCEVSPSGEGLKLFMFGRMPEGMKTEYHLPGGVDIEVYQRGRYFTVTGSRYKLSSDTVADRTEELANLFKFIQAAGEKYLGEGDDKDVAQEAMKHLAPERADRYLDWVSVGMALHSVDDGLLDTWDEWSQQSDKYSAGTCVSKWESFGGYGDKPLGIGSLIRWAREDTGWTPPRRKGSDGDGDEPKKSQATLLVELAENCYLFHDAGGEAYARFEVDGHLEVCLLRNRAFKLFLKHQFYLQHNKSPSSQAINDALGVIEGNALYDGAEHEVHVRVASHDGKVYIDLVNAKWQVVEVDGDGWRILDESPVMFRRAKAMLSLPMPVEGGSITQLWDFLNVSPEDRPLVVAWLVAALRPVGPYPALAVHGEQGSAKSTGCRLLRELVDPNKALVRSEPREPRDLMITANNGQVIALDNLSRVSPWLSDCLCRLATGGGFSTRTLYENDEETIFTSQRPVLLNGIEDLATRSDLLDRCLLVNLPRIEQDKRRPEADLQRDFDTAKPGIFGALLTAVSTAIRRLPTTSLSELPRMADFALWATAAEPALGLQDGEFIASYFDNRASGNETALEASPIGKAVVDFITTVEEWEGTATDLLTGLEKMVDERTRGSKAWPKSPRSLSGHIKRIAPNLRQAGIGVELGRTRRGSSIALTRTSTESCVTSVTSVTETESTEFFG